MKIKMKMMKMKVKMSMMMMKKVSHDDGYFVMKVILMFFFLSVSIRCLTKGKLKKRKHGKHIFLKQYAFQTKGSSAVGVSRESKFEYKNYIYNYILTAVTKARKEKL